MMYELRDIGFSTAVGIGGDPVIGTTHIDCLQAFQEDPEDRRHRDDRRDRRRRRGAGPGAFIEQHVTKPVVGYVAGFTAPEGKDDGARRRDHLGFLGHGAGQEGRPWKKAGVRVGKTPSEDPPPLVRGLF